jgi:hypothetical protein
MLVFEAIFAFLRRSLGSILRAMFGWATLALFGEVREKERTFLTIVVAAAAVWPLLLVGTIFPRQAALLLAVMPVPKGAPEEIVRAVWIALTLLIPAGVGWALMRRNRDAARGERREWWRSLLLGFPTTLGLGLGFLFVCVAIPVRKVRALFSGLKEEHVALAIEPESYKETVAQMREALERGGVPVVSARPPWGTRALGRLLHVFAGAVLRKYQPENLEFLTSPEVQLTFYPNGVRAFGREPIVARTQALLAETATATPALLCMSPEAQKIEKRIKALWDRRTEKRETLDVELQAVARELARTPLGFRDWETLYRELLQVVVASRGASRLIQSALASERESDRASESPGERRRRRVAAKRLRRVARKARTYGGDRLRKAAADRSLKVIEKVAERMLQVFARR